MAETGILPPKFYVIKEYAQKNLPGQMGLAGLVLWWLLLIFPEAPGVYAFLPVEKSCASFLGVQGLNWDSTSKILYPMIALRQKLPLQTALAGLGLLRASSHRPFKHRSSVPPFCGKQLVFYSRHKWLK